MKLLLDMNLSPIWVRFLEEQRVRGGALEHDWRAHGD